MPGLVGFAGDFEPDQGKPFLDKMALALEPEARFQRALFIEEGIGLGRVSLGVVNPEPQPIWNEDHTLCIVMEGEIYDYASLKQELIEDGHSFNVNNDAEFMLHLFEAYGEDFAEKLNGAFVAAIWDTRAKKLTLVNDRLGLHPLYYTHRNGKLLFASGVRALLADPALPRTVDCTAIAQFLTFDHVLGDRTLLEQVKLFPQASLLTYAEGRFTIRPYWKLKYPDVYQNRSEEALLEQLNYYLRQAVNRQRPDGHPAGVLLSGGLDSRVLASFLREGPTGNGFHTFTFGIPGCDDARIAREVAKKLGTRHHFFPLKPDFLLQTADNAVRLTDGLGNLINLHALATLEEEVQHTQVLYKGFMGDALLGFALRRPFWGEYSPEVEDEVHLSIHALQGVITFNRTEKQSLYTRRFRQQVGNTVFDSYHAYMQASGSRLLADQRLYFDMTQRVPRMTINGVEAVRQRAVVRLPFCDNDLYEFATTVPPGYQFERYLSRTAFIRAFPEMAQIPISDTGLPMMLCAREVLERGRQVLRWHLEQRGLPPLLGPARRPYKDYTNWFRTVLRSWVEANLLSKTASERGYFNPQYVQLMVAEHMAGKDHTVKLGALLSLELWHQQFID